MPIVGSCPFFNSGLEVCATTLLGGPFLEGSDFIMTVQ